QQIQQQIQQAVSNAVTEVEARQAEKTKQLVAYIENKKVETLRRVRWRGGHSSPASRVRSSFHNRGRPGSAQPAARRDPAGTRQDRGRGYRTRAGTPVGAGR